MSNIDPLYLLTPTVVLLFSFGLVIYWYRRRDFTRWTLIYSLAAYAGAIALKELVQVATLGPITQLSGADPYALGVYYGAQTAVFEVGGAFVLAQMAVASRRFIARDAEGFGLALAFWENAVLIALPLLLDYLTYYAILSEPGSGAARSLAPILMRDAPALFYVPGGALPLIAWAILERVSSLLAHWAWGLLAVLAAVRRRPAYVALAAPLGFAVDFLVPFEPSLGLGPFETLLLAVAAVGFLAALAVRRWDRVRPDDLAGPPPFPGASPPPPPPGLGS